MARRRNLSDKLNPEGKKPKGWQAQIQPPTPEPEPEPKKLTKEEREAIRIRARRARRATFDLPPPIKRKFAEWSIEYGVPQSQMVALAALLLHDAIASDTIDIEGIREKSTSPKFAFNLMLEELIAEMKND